MDIEQPKTQQPQTQKSSPVCIIVIGMAGSGKTTFVDRYFKMNSSSNSIFSINLDPAVKIIPYQPVIDIRETHQYRKIMKEYQLGPNGAILTALNLYTSQPERIITKMQQLLTQAPNSTFVIDIPGQIEAFTWSASSMILTKAISLIMPVVLVYVVDSQRCQNPNSYLSNLLFAQSIECRISCPMIICLNKCDVVVDGKCELWTTDYDEFTKALNKQDNYLATLSKSVVLYMSEFFEKFLICSVSSKTGDGFKQLQGLLQKATAQFIKNSQAQSKKIIAKNEKQIQMQIANIKLSEEKTGKDLTMNIEK